MINPSDLRHLVDNDKIAFAGKFYNFDEITEDEEVLKVFLDATESLVDSEKAKAISDFAANLKVKLENFVMSHDYSDLAGRVNELVYKISIFQKAQDKEESLFSIFKKKQEFMTYLSTADHESPVGYVLTSRYEELKNDKDTGVLLFKKFPKEFDVIFEDPLKEECIQEAFTSTGILPDLTSCIMRFKNYEIRDFLIQALFQIKDRYGELEEKGFVTLVGFLSLNPSAEQVVAMKKRLDDFSKLFKDGNKLQDILHLLQKLCETDKIAPENKAGVFLDCFQITNTEGMKASKKPEIKARDNQETVKRIKLMLASINVLDRGDLASLDHISAESLITKLTGPLFAKVGIDDSIHKAFAERFLESRMPLAIFQYTSVQDEPEVLAAIGQFILDVTSGEFIENRHRNNSHKEFLDPETLRKWEEGGKEVVSEKNVIIDSEDWKDLFLCGSEVHGSCQSVNGSSDLNKALLGYVLDGKCRVLCLKDHENGPIRARAIIKIMLDEDNNPVLFLDNSYPPGHKDEFINFALARAEAIGLPLFIQTSTEFAGFTYDKKEDKTLHSIKNVAPYEYSDAAGGLQLGTYNHEGFRIVSKE